METQRAHVSSIRHLSLVAWKHYTLRLSVTNVFYVTIKFRALYQRSTIYKTGQRICFLTVVPRQPPIRSGHCTKSSLKNIFCSLSHRLRRLTHSHKVVICRVTILGDKESGTEREAGKKHVEIFGRWRGERILCLQSLKRHTFSVVCVASKVFYRLCVRLQKCLIHSCNFLTVKEARVGSYRA